ncbi:hypothetical protein GWN63_00355, partial [Candidatus Bathyarchaeota archaeon]|nr:hypothetical protein [Candidatus Bathyarchaeota archaeon]NIU80693.1 hypothetical protein [Candidatus Bathyarchaeota archaeon]NIV67310.1 hypothetical protein [Candidatus Bathyarchaeota archaeon]NIW16770.1 hypothetical protein [Candidatus Bathyarchaeota archaeon]NIW33984.1 hypothetical protein [Candidatus Bathyarchaeota archaeon]
GVDIEFENFYLVGGYRFPEELGERAEDTGLEYLGKIAYDKKVERFVLEGRSLLDLPSDSPAYRSVKKIMQRAKYSERISLSGGNKER